MGGGGGGIGFIVLQLKIMLKVLLFYDVTSGSLGGSNDARRPAIDQGCLKSILRWCPYDGWLVGCFGFNGPLRQYFSLYRAISQREGERGEKG